MTLETMHRRTDPPTSKAAAARVLPKLRDTAAYVLRKMRELHRRNGRRGCTDRELIEASREYRSPTTGRKPDDNTFRTARSRLRKLGYVEAGDETRDGFTAWIPLDNEQVVEKLTARQTGSLF